MGLYRIVARSVTATAGTLLIALGVQQFLRVTGSYYCCRLYVHGPVAILWTIAGWILLLVAFRDALGTEHLSLSKVAEAF